MADQKSDRIKTYDLDVENKQTIVNWDYAGCPEPDVYRLEDFPEDIQIRYALHGMAQVHGDEHSGFRKKGKTPAEAREMSMEKMDNHKLGLWSTRGDGGDLAEAIVALNPKLDLADVKASCKAASQEQKAAWRKDPAVRAELLRMQAERAGKVAKDAKETIDFGAMFAKAESDDAA